jgi:probable rRNA maturation factor
MPLLLRKSSPTLSASALSRFATRAQREVGISGGVDILVTGNIEMRRLNREFRGKNRPTDVLSFPSPIDDGGDIAVSLEIAKQSARELGHSITEELKVLILHGMIHLAGYDHESDKGEMERFEQQLRIKLALPSSLIERSNNGTKKPGAKRARSRKR